MSQTGYTPIQLYRTTTSGAAPDAANLTAGELAININDADMALYAENQSGVVKRLMNNPAGLKYPTTDGTVNQIMVTNGSGVLSWAPGASGTYLPLAGGTMTGAITFAAGQTIANLASGSAGTIPYQTASGTTAMLAVGTLGQVLTSAGAAAPTWSTPAAATKTISNKTGAYTIVSGDLGSIINCTSGTFTVSLTAAASLGSGFTCTIWNTGTGAITIDPNASETIDGVTTLILQQGEGLAVVCNGTNWETDDKKPMRAYAENFTAAYSRPIASGSESIAMGNGSTASGGASIAYGYSSVAGSNNSVAFGINSGSQGSVTATGAGAMALGGSYASGADSFAAAIANNTSSYGAKGANSVAIGDSALASAAHSIAINGYSTASGIYSVAISSSTASGLRSFAVGSSCVAAGTDSIALGNAAKSSQIGKYSFASNIFSAGGDAQAGKIVLRAETTTTTAVALTSDGGAASTNNQLILPNNSAHTFSILVVARRDGYSNSSAGYKFEGIIERLGSAASTTLVAVSKTVLGEGSNATTWDVNVAADTTNGGLSVTATGAAASTIRWVAVVDTSEVSG